MKSLIVIGIARAGKSTLAAGVARKIGAAGIPVSLMSADALMGGLQSVKKASFWYSWVYRPIKHLIPALSRRYKRQLGRDLAAFSRLALAEQDVVSTVIYEGCYLWPADAVRMFDPKRFKIVAIGYPNMTIEQKMADVRKYDKDSPAQKRSDERLHEYIRIAIENSRVMERECKKYNIPFIDTSYDYRGEIKKFVDNSLEFLK